MAVLFPEAKTRKRVQSAASGQLASWKDGLVAAEGLLAVPRSAFVPAGEAPETEPGVRQTMLRQAGRLCGDLGVDAVVFVQVRARITHPRPEAFIVMENRTDGKLSMAQTMVIVDRTGRIIVDMGWPSLGKDARSRDLLPLYRGAGRDAVSDGNIDLSDPKKKVPHAFIALADESAGDLMTALRKAAGK
jgi:D-serine deaminase-like pyridoxal phosphate-dependent protein